MGAVASIDATGGAGAGVLDAAAGALAELAALARPAVAGAALGVGALGTADPSAGAEAAPSLGERAGGAAHPSNADDEGGAPPTINADATRAHG